MSIFADQMRELQKYSDDPEKAHSEADNLLCSALEAAGMDDVVREYGKLQEVCAWWADV